MALITENPYDYRHIITRVPSLSQDWSYLRYALIERQEESARRTWTSKYNTYNALTLVVMNFGKAFYRGADIHNH